VSDDTIEKIKAELFRLHARPEDVGVDGIVVGDRGAWKRRPSIRATE
jgi:hypothetical protein